MKKYSISGSIIGLIITVVLLIVSEQGYRCYDYCPPSNGLPYIIMVNGWEIIAIIIVIGILVGTLLGWIIGKIRARIR
jgi:putative effector of murein hydrolase LrgA (UPF0299 family)